MKVVAFTKGDSIMGSERHILECDICHENDRNKLMVENIGISVGMGGQEYCFCEKCWTSKDLGKNLLKLLGFEKMGKMKIMDSCLDIEEIG